MLQSEAYSLLAIVKDILNNELTPLTPVDPNDPDIVAKINAINSGIDSIDGTIQQIDLSALKGDKGDKGDPASPAPYGFFDLGAFSIPAVDSAFFVPDALYGNLQTENGNILLKAGYSYDIEVNFFINFTSTSTGYLLYDIVSSLFSTPSFQESATVSSTSTYRDSFPLRFITPKIEQDLEIPLFARARLNCSAIYRGHVLVRGHNA